MTNTNNNFLYVQVKNYILKLINDNISIPEYKLPTEAEIMKSQNVSRITVRKAFEDLIGLNIVTRIKGLGTFVNRGVTKDTLRPYFTNESCNVQKVAAILPLFNSQHNMEISTALTQATTNAKLFVSYSEMSVEKEQKLINEALDMGIVGLLIYPIDNDVYNSSLIDLAATNFPVIMIDRYLPGLNFGYVSSDHAEMSALAVNHLLQRGHKHILFFNANIKTNTSLAERHSSYIRTLENNNNYTNYLFIFDGNEDNTSVKFCDKFRQYLKENPNITAIITADYASGIHLMQMFKLLGLSFPKDYEVVFFDFKIPQDQIGITVDYPTHVEQDSFSLGFEAVKMLNEALSGQQIRSKKTLVPVKLIQGSSTRKL